MSGDSSYLPGEVIDRIKFDNTNEKLVAEGKTPAVGERVLMGITKASLQTESFISCLLYTSPSPRDRTRSRMPSSA